MPSTTKSKHTITIKLYNNYPVMRPRKQKMRVGDSVVYVTDPPNHKFRVEFTSSPFNRKHPITDSRPRKVKNEGHFTALCFIEGPDGTLVGGNTEATSTYGGEHDVRP